MEDRAGEIGNLQDKAEIRRSRQAALEALEDRMRAAGWEINPERADGKRVIWLSLDGERGVLVPQDVDAKDFEPLLTNAEQVFDPVGWDPYVLRTQLAQIRAWAETERDRSYICRDDALARNDTWQGGIWHGRKNAMVDLIANLNEGTWQ